MELGCHSWMDCLATELFLNSRFPDTVLVTLFHTAAELFINSRFPDTVLVTLFHTAAELFLDSRFPDTVLVTLFHTAVELFLDSRFPDTVFVTLFCTAAELFLNSRFPDTVLVTLFHTAVETAISEVHKLLGTGGVPTSLTSFFWSWLTVSSVFTGRSQRTSYSSPPPPPTHTHTHTYSLFSLYGSERTDELFTPPPPPPHTHTIHTFTIRNKPYGFCKRKPPCLLTPTCFDLTTIQATILGKTSVYSAVVRRDQVSLNTGPCPFISKPAQHISTLLIIMNT